jgi:hypothetical protein
MRPTLSSTISILSLSLLTLLSACGGGGGGGDKLTPEPPVGKLTFTGASAGTYVVNPAETNVSGTAPIRVELADSAPTFTITFTYDSTGSAINRLELVVGGTTSYACVSTACNGMALDKAAKTLKFTNSNLPGPSSTSTTVNGTVSW